MYIDMYLFIYTYMCLYAHTYTYVYTYTYAYIYTCNPMCMDMWYYSLCNLDQYPARFI